MLNKLFPSSRLIRAEDLRKTWRIIVSTITCQVIGISLGVIFDLHPDRFLSAWIGGAIATFPAVILGILWCYKKRMFREGIPFITLIFFISVSVFLSFAGCNLAREGREFKVMVKSLRTINERDLPSITVYTNYQQKVIKEINDTQVIRKFITACRDVEGEHIQNSKPCGTIKRYYLDLSGSTPKDIILDHCESEYATGSFAESDGHRTTYHGGFHSKSLKPWLQTYIID